MRDSNIKIAYDSASVLQALQNNNMTSEYCVVPLLEPDGKRAECHDEVSEEVGVVALRGRLLQLQRRVQRRQRPAAAPARAPAPAPRRQAVQQHRAWGAQQLKRHIATCTFQFYTDKTLRQMSDQVTC